MENIRGLILSQDPLIFATETSTYPVIGHADKISRLVNGAPCTIFIVPAWTLDGKGEINKEVMKKFELEFPNSKLIILANDDVDAREAATAGADYRIINQNAFLDNNLFRPVVAEKKYDAIYNGQLLAFKRHYLAANVNSLALAFYGNDLDYYEKIREILPNAAYLNGEKRENVSPSANQFHWLSPARLSQHYSESYCGLCLSKAEGAMYSSAEYLLSGIPVVSTQNSGGRNEFFDDSNCIFVADDPQSVNEAVQHWVNNPPDPEMIRNDFLSKAQKFRTKFFDTVDDIIRQSGHAYSDFENTFMQNVFVDKLWKSRTPSTEFEKLSK